MASSYPRNWISCASNKSSAVAWMAVGRGMEYSQAGGKPVTCVGMTDVENVAFEQSPLVKAGSLEDVTLDTEKKKK